MRTSGKKLVCQQRIFSSHSTEPSRPVLCVPPCSHHLGFLHVLHFPSLDLAACYGSISSPRLSRLRLENLKACRKILGKNQNESRDNVDKIHYKSTDKSSQMVNSRLLFFSCPSLLLSCQKSESFAVIILKTERKTPGPGTEVVCHV